MFQRRHLGVLGFSATVLVVAATSLAQTPSQISATSPPPVIGSIVGIVYAEDGVTPLPGIEVQTTHVETNDLITNLQTFENGTFVAEEVPAGVYRFSVVRDGVTYPVVERVDGRLPVEFILRTCFRVVEEDKQAYLMDGVTCNPQLIEALLSSGGPGVLGTLGGAGAAGAAGATGAVSTVGLGTLGTISAGSPIFIAGAGAAASGATIHFIPPVREREASLPRRFQICHRPGTQYERTITIRRFSWPFHRAHGDFIGTCEGGPQPPP